MNPNLKYAPKPYKIKNYILNAMTVPKSWQAIAIARHVFSIKIILAIEQVTITVFQVVFATAEI